MNNNRQIHHIISRARKLVEALLDSTSFLHLDAKQDPGWASHQYSIDNGALRNTQVSRMLIGFKNA